VFIRQNVRKYKYLFNKYGSSSASYQKYKSFDKMKQNYDTMNVAELFKLIKDNNLQVFMTKDEMLHIVRLINTKVLRKGEMDSLNFEGFLKFVT